MGWTAQGNGGVIIPQVVKKEQTLLLGMWFGGCGNIQSKIGHDDLEGVFQPEGFRENRTVPKPPAPWQAVTPRVAVWAASTRRWMSVYLCYLLSK